jgi:hypothetical protein
MKGSAIILIVAGIALGFYGTSASTGQGQLHLAGGLLVFFGVVLLIVSVFLTSRRDALMSQLEEYQGVAGPDGRMPTGFDASRFREFDKGGILRTVMDAQNEAGDDPDALADILRQKLGGEATVIEGGSSTAFSAGTGQDPVSLLSTLNDLRDKGVLTDEQFEEQKARLLD